MKYLKYCLLVFLLGIVTLDLIYVIFRKGYNNYNKFEQSKMTEIMNGKSTYDMLFIGSSRSFYHINPAIIDSALRVSSFNAGIDGANLGEAKLILECYLKNHPAPKILVTDIATPSFDIPDNYLFNANIYYPFLNNTIVFNRLKPFKRVYLLKYLPFLQITECDDFLRESAVEGLLGQEKPLEPHYKGYLESGRDTISLPFKIKYLTTNYPVGVKGIEYLKSIIETCNQNHIRLILTYSPVYKKKDEELNPQFFQTIDSISREEGIDFLNYRTVPLSEDHRMFRDELHLNKSGANCFSILLAKDLERFL